MPVTISRKQPTSKTMRIDPRELRNKAAISLRIDQDVLDWFKSRGRGYQTRINTVLRAFRDASL